MIKVVSVIKDSYVLVLSLLIRSDIELWRIHKWIVNWVYDLGLERIRAWGFLIWLENESMERIEMFFEMKELMLGGGNEWNLFKCALA